MKIDNLSDIDYLRETLLCKITEKALIEKVKYSISLSVLRGIYYGLEHPIVIDHDKIKSKTY